MKNLIYYLLLLCSLSNYAQQYTLIPDINFENQLISDGIESGPPDGKVLTSLISSLTTLDVAFSSIASLQGIQDFSALQNLVCGLTDLTSLDLSNNLALVRLECQISQITTLNISQNVNLKYLYCDRNQLTTLNVSQNPALEIIDCSLNNLQSLNVSSNNLLSYLRCDSNQLTSLNLKNGANNLLAYNSIYALFGNNPNLSCIQVDNVAYSNTYWSNLKDNTAVYSTNCSTLNVNDAFFSTMEVYPNPTNGILNINNVFLEKAILYDALGRITSTKIFKNSQNNDFDLSSFSKGIYYISLQTQNATTVRKIILQ